MRKLRFWNKNPTPIDEIITDVLAEMQQVGVDSQEYPKLLAYLEKLHGLNAKQRRQPISSDTAAIVLGNLLGILIIIAYEQKHVMTSQGLKELLRPKLT